MAIELNTDILATAWLVEESAKQTDQTQYAAAFALANGYLGYRADQFSRPSPCVLGGLKAAGEACQIWAPDGLWMQIHVGDQEFLLGGKRQMNLHQALFQLVGEQEVAQGLLTWQQERFVSAYDLHLLGQQTQLFSSSPLLLTVEVGIQLPLASEDLQQLQLGETPYISVQAAYEENQLATVLGLEWEGAVLLDAKIKRESQRIYHRLAFQLSPDRPLVIEQLCSYYHSQDMTRLAERPRYQGTLDPFIAAKQDVEDVLDSGYLYARQVHEQQWINRWEAVDIQVERDESLQIGLRYGLFQQLMHSPVHADLPIGIHGLTEAEISADLRPFLTFNKSPYHIWEEFALPKPLAQQMPRFSQKSELAEVLHACWEEEGWLLIPFGLIWPILSEMLGLRIEGNELLLSFEPLADLPHLSCRLFPDQQAIDLILTPQFIELTASILNLQPIRVSVGEESFTLRAGQSQKLSWSLN